MTTLTDLNNRDDDKIKTTIIQLSTQIKNLKVDEFKNKRYITALEEQIKKLSIQLKEINQKPKFDITSILKEINEESVKEKGLTKEQILQLDNDIEKKIKMLMI
jgi:predicted  nucleic acid-binding Zn-ribbon protein